MKCKLKNWARILGSLAVIVTVPNAVDKFAIGDDLLCYAVHFLIIYLLTVKLITMFPSVVCSMY